MHVRSLARTASRKHAAAPEGRPFLGRDIGQSSSFDSHYPPTPELLSAIRAPLWIYGHVHGHCVADVSGTRTIRNALGYPNERYVGQDGVLVWPFDPAFVVNIEPQSMRR